VIDHYEDRAEFVAIDGEQTPGAVWEEIKATIDDHAA
jgi:adenylate kinase family enzyme